ncbi:MAG: type IV toxin-antitoxin system AbiEi family antitoxin domain-containing protein [Burkholderiales bacterium]
MTKLGRHATPAGVRKEGVARAFAELVQARGRPGFTVRELLSGAALPARAAWDQLRRLEKAGAVRRVTPRHDYYLIVPPEYRGVGAPPVQWWLGPYFASIGQAYYLALLSAAAHYGAAHQAVQEAQVMVQKPRRPLALGRARIRFFVKRTLPITPVAKIPADYSVLTVSSPEATLLDLVRHAKRVGGVARVLQVAAELLGRCTAAGLAEALDRDDEVANAQRVGFLLEACGAETLARAVERWLKSRRMLPVPLVPAGRTRLALPENRRWRILVNAKLQSAA